MNRDFPCRSCFCLFSILILAGAPLSIAGDWEGPVPRDAWTQRLITLFGETPSARITGNGRLTVASAHGGLISCRWPGMAGAEQITPMQAFLPYDQQLLDGRPLGGCWWGVENADGISWIGLPPWERESGRLAEDGGDDVFINPTAGVRATIRITVDGALDLVTTQLILAGCAACPKVVWMQQCAPASARWMDWPDALPPPGAWGDVVWVDALRQRGVQLRLDDLSERTQEHLARLAAKNSVAAEWGALGEGIWAGGWVNTDATIVSRTPAEKRRNPSPETTPLFFKGVPRIQGNDYIATAMLAFGKNLDQVTQLLDGRQSAQSVTPARPSTGTEISTALQWLTAATDRDTGVTVQVPAAARALAVTSPEWVFWIGQAWAFNGHPDKAKAQVNLLLKALASRPAGLPDGAMPALLTPSGKPAAPAFTLSPAAAAWTILACARVAQALPSDQNATTLTQWWPQVAPVMEFLHRWTDPATGAPRPGFVSEKMCTQSTEEALLLVGLAVDTAIDLSQRTNQSPPEEWFTWRGQLDALLRFQMVNQGARGWPLSASAAYLAGDIFSPENSLQNALASVGGETRPLAEWPDLIARRLQALNAGKSPIRDSLDAAMRLVAARRSLPWID